MLDSVPILFAQRGADAAAAAGALAGSCVFGLIFLAIAVLFIASFWKIFDKAGEPGWAAIVPIYNIIVLCRVAGKPEWWVLLFFIPVVNIVISIMVWAALCERFGKDGGFVIGIILLPYIFLPILAFGDAQYQGSRGGGSYGRRRRSRRYDDDDDDDDDDDRPRRRSVSRRRDDDDDDDDDDVDYADEDDDDDDEDEDDRPPRRRSPPRPRPRSRRDDDDDD
jgi:hypothetical protein